MIYGIRGVYLRLREGQRMGVEKLAGAGQADKDYSNELFDTLAGRLARVFTLSKKRADTVGEPPPKF